jgi:hypothetical protein
MANTIYNSFKRDLLLALINCQADTIKVMLVGPSYTFDVDAHEKRSDVIAHEVSGPGYTAGGVALTAKTVTLDLPNNQAVFDADNPVITSTTITGAIGAIVYKARGGAASADELICYNEFAAPASSTSGDFTININVNGVARVS